MPTPTLIVDVVLPLALPGAYTYTVPAALCGQIGVGSRVVVPLGKSKFYTGIVIRCPGTPPAEDIRLKEVTEVVDGTPLILPTQLDFWRWMAQYYMCTPGEVMKAALPSGLKLESETFVELVPDFEETDAPSKHDLNVLDVLRGEKAVSIDSLRKKMGTTGGLLPSLRRLMDIGAVKVHESLSRSYRPRTEQHIRFTQEYHSEQSQHTLLDTLGKRSPRQFALVSALISNGASSRQTLHNIIKEDMAAAITALRKKGVIETFDVKVERLKPQGEEAGTPYSPLSAAQQKAHDDILDCWRKKDVCLLHGVTSSGKTEVYIRLIERELAAGRQVLYLLPEIALTTQITTRLGHIFGNRMGVYHSKFPDAERVELWQRQLTDRAFPLILGVRSSLFLPFNNLGLIIVDEEHETSYKQQDPAPRYNARDAAIVLARQCGAKVLLGTATPAIETYYNATITHKYEHVELAERFGGICLPQIIVEDVKELRRKKLMKSLFSPRLIEEVRTALQQGEQVILFRNRRGYAPMIECHSCGWTPRCTACDVSLTFHQNQHKLVCHYCGATYDVPRQCPNCEETDLRDIGYGTEKIEECVKQFFPEARTTRMDLDTTRTRTAYEKIIRDFQQGTTNLLIGTQMVTKGLDFDRVRVVGILDADGMMSQPNFRAGERAFQMMAQVAGRAGRRGKQGLVILQTRQPELGLIRQVVENDYTAMFGAQLIEREQFRWPPYFRIISILVKHRTEEVCAHAAEALAALLRPHFGDGLLGPDRPAVGRIQHLHLRQLILKIPPALPAQGVRRTLLAARTALTTQPTYSSIAIHFDVDPM